MQAQQPMQNPTSKNKKQKRTMPVSCTVSMARQAEEDWLYLTNTMPCTAQRGTARTA